MYQNVEFWNWLLGQKKGFENDTLQTVKVEELIQKPLEDRTLKLNGKKVKINFVTIDFDSGENLPNVNLEVSINNKKVTLPNSSGGSSRFSVEGKYTDELSIVAKKANYKKNDTTIYKQNFEDLVIKSENESEIEIPLHLFTCNDGYAEGGEVVMVMEFAMGKKDGSFILDYYTNGQPDSIIVYNGRKKEIGSIKPVFVYGGKTDKDFGVGVGGEKVILLNGKNFVTVRAVGLSRNWSFNVNCPF